jgi:hypothetical protein
MLPRILLKTITHARWMKFAGLNRAIGASQEALLMRMVAEAADTAFGRAHNFGSIRSRADFQRHVPIGTWDDFEPYIDRIVAGETGVLTNEGAPMMFNKTSGTTSKPKLIPVGARMTYGNGVTQKLWAYHAIQTHPNFLNGKAIPLVNKAVEGHTNLKVPYGSVSGMMFKNAHAIAKRRYAYPYDVVEIGDYLARRYTLMRLAVPENVTFIPGSNPSSLVKMFEAADDMKAALLRDIHDGTLTSEVDVAPEIRSALAPKLKANPARARELERLSGTGRLRPRDYWPNLKLIGCWKGGTVGQFTSQLQDWCAEGLVLRDTGYMSSEAHVSIPITDRGSEGLLTIHTNVFEFVPEEEWGQPGARALFADELEVGGTYQILLTTPSGLYRYAINDVIEVVDMFGGAPLIRFLRKGRDVVNIHGEKVSANQVIAAMAAATAAIGLKVAHFMVVPDAEKSRYCLHVEFESDAPGMGQLGRTFDAELGALNYLFKGALHNGLLKPSAIHVMQTGWFNAIAATQVAAGMRDTQFKPTVVGPVVLHGELLQQELDTVH